MAIINSVISGGGAPVSADTTMSLPIDVETSGNDISLFGGSYTSTLNASTTGQTKGYKNDAYIVLNQDDTESVVLSQTETFPSGSFKSAVMSSTSVYLDDTKTNIIGTTTPTGFEVSYEPTVERLTENFTRVGSPTITDGVLGNLNSSNYLEFPSVGIGTADSWEIFTKVKTSSSTSSGYFILGGGGTSCFDYGIASNVWKFFLSSNGSSWNLASNISNNINASTSTWYYVKFYFTGTKYEMDVSTDGETWTNVAEYASTTKVYDCPTMRVGNSNDRSWPWKDYIDLNETYIKVNGEIVWRPIVQPSAGYITVGEGYSYIDENTPPFSLSSDLTQEFSQLLVHSEDFVEETNSNPKTNYIVVGNFPIDACGLGKVDGGMVGNKTISNDFSTLEVGVKITTDGNVNTNQIFFGTTNNNSTPIALNVSSGKFRLYLSSNGSGYDIASDVAGSYSVQNNTTYWVKLVFDGTRYVLSYSLDGVTFTDDITVTSSTKVYSFTPTVGAWIKNGTSINDKLIGWIHVADAYVKKDGDVVWASLENTTVKRGTLFLTKPTSSTTSDAVCANSVSSTQVQTYEIIGTDVVVDSNHRATGFSSSSYITFPFGCYVNAYSSFEIVIHFKTPAVMSNNEPLGLDTSLSYGTKIIVQSNGNFTVSSGGSSGTIGASIQPDTEYWLKIQQPGGVASLSTDGETYTQLTTGTPITYGYFDGLFNEICLGYAYNESYAFSGTIYLDDCYVKLDGDAIFAPFITKATSVSPTPTGTYAGSVVTPLDMNATVTMDSTLTKLISVE